MLVLEDRVNIRLNRLRAMLSKVFFLPYDSLSCSLQAPNPLLIKW